MNFEDAEDTVHAWLRNMRGGHAFSLAEGDEMIETINRSDATRERKAGLARNVVEQVCLSLAETCGFEETAAALDMIGIGVTPHLRPKLTVDKAQEAADELTRALFAGEKEWCMDEVERVFEDCCNSHGTEEEKEALIEKFSAKCTAFAIHIHGADAVNAAIQ